MQQRFVELLLFYPVFLFSLSLHEAAHAWMSNRLGDATARYLGRITLNPLPHMDMLGTAFLPLFGILTQSPVIGWGKPVPVDTRYLKNPRRDHLWIALMGPLSNIFLACVFAFFARGLLTTVDLFLNEFTAGDVGSSLVKGLFSICQIGVFLNLMLALFNLLPMPPLDGGAILIGLLPDSLLHVFDQFSQYSFLILLLFFMTGILKYLLIPVMYFAHLLLPF